MRTYKHVIKTECGNKVEVYARPETKNFDGNVEHSLMTEDGRTVTFTLFQDLSVFPVTKYVAGTIDVDGKFSAKLSEFSWSWDYGVVTISYELLDGIERPVYDYLTEAGA